MAWDLSIVQSFYPFQGLHGINGTTVDDLRELLHNAAIVLTEINWDYGMDK